ncbi:hypothetical protein HY224_00875 [Candidatus Uhrbacteria bacterium]|nr:hypothetical protein [Candidatus Uhrbacteria bacterium]
MKTYFLSTSKFGDPTDKQIVRLLESLGLQIFSNRVELSRGVVQGASAKRNEESGESLMSKIDFIIIEATNFDDQARYVVANAVSQKKPILILNSKESISDQAMGSLKKDKSLAVFFKIKHYNSSNLEKILSDFIGGLEAGTEANRPDIKFTLRITPAIDRYLTWKSHVASLSKADLLRKILVEEIIGKDGSSAMMLFMVMMYIALLAMWGVLIIYAIYNRLRTSLSRLVQNMSFVSGRT